MDQRPHDLEPSGLTIHRTAPRIEELTVTGVVLDPGPSLGPEQGEHAGRDRSQGARHHVVSRRSSRSANAARILALCAEVWALQQSCPYSVSAPASWRVH